MKINLINPATGQIKNAKIGFSWTTFFFGFWPALFRGDWLWFLVILITEILLGLKTYAVGSLVICIIFAFIYNKIYINQLINKGWKAANAYSNDALIYKGFIAPNNEFKINNQNQAHPSITVQKHSHPVSVILAILVAICVVGFVYFSFGGIIASQFNNFINPSNTNVNSNQETPSVPGSSNDNYQAPPAKSDNQANYSGNSGNNQINHSNRPVNSSSIEQNKTSNNQSNNPSNEQQNDNESQPDDSQSNSNHN